MQDQQQQECFTISDLQQLVTQSPDQVNIIDVRTPEEYAENHIPGAINIQVSELESRTTGLSKENIIITACSKGGGRSVLGVVILKQSGFSKASFLCGGTLGWFALSS